VVFVAHLDHPGFIFPPPEGARADGTNRYKAIFEGRVDDAFFSNAPIRLYHSHDVQGIPARIVHADPYDSSKDHRDVIIEAEENTEGAVLGMWDLPLFSLEHGLVKARACDDLVGCAAIIEALDILSKEDNVDIGAVFSRAEEAGFCGVLCMLQEETFQPLLPHDAIFISVETSSEVPGISLGDGAIIRIGDKATTFDGVISDILWKVSRDRDIKARRALMDGGTCEASVFVRAGFRTAALCIPLRNYHNMDKKKGSLAMEIVAESDIQSLVELIAGLAHSTTFGEMEEHPVLKGYDLFLEKGRNNLSPIPLSEVGVW
jgi:endoglucanase